MISPLRLCLLFFCCAALAPAQTARPPAHFDIVQGRAVIEGDIDIGPAQAPDLAVARPNGFYRAGDQFRWTNATIPYTIDADIPNPQRILDAMAAWTAATPIRFTPRASQPNFVHLIRQQSNGVCFSAIGMVGGEQFLRVDDGCSANGIIHEFGHSIGLYHEQTRPDRAFYVDVNLSNIDKRYSSDSTLNTAGVESGPFDYGSIMEYNAFETDLAVQVEAIRTIPAGIPIDGSAHGLSAGDIDTVSRMYGATPTSVTITTDPAGLDVIVDGALVTAPQTFAWTPGSVHSLDTPATERDGTPMRYLFGRWSDNQPKSHSITVDLALTVYSANFIRQYLVQTGVSPAGAGAVSIDPASPDGYYTEHTRVTVTAKPAAGNSFSGWNGTGSLIFVNVHGFLDSPASFLVTIPNLNYIAHFTTGPLLTVAADPPDLPITVGTSRGAAPRAVALNPGASVQVTADPVITAGVGSAEYTFTGWSDSGAATHTVTAPASPPYPVLTAMYQLKYLVTSTFTGRGAVTVSPSSPDGYYAPGTVLTFAATPAAGFQFMGWTGDLSGTNRTQTLTVNSQTYVQASFAQPFTLVAGSVVNAASFLSGPVSPGEIVTLFGLDIGPATLTTLQFDASNRVATTLAATRVLFDGLAAPLIYVSQNQISAIVPYAVAGKTSTSVQVQLNGQTSNTLVLPVGQSAPGMFTLDSSGRGAAALLNENGSVNGPSNPALKGSEVVLYVTGEGQTTPPGVDGKLANTTPLPKPNAAVSVRIGGPPGIGKDCPIDYYGAAPTLVAGLMQINCRIPLDVPSGSVPLSFTVGNTTSVDMTTIQIR